jgi:hypothetical protein
VQLSINQTAVSIMEPEASRSESNKSTQGLRAQRGTLAARESIQNQAKFALAAFLALILVIVLLLLQVQADAEGGVMAKHTRPLTFSLVLVCVKLFFGFLPRSDPAPRG